MIDLNETGGKIDVLSQGEISELRDEPTDHKEVLIVRKGVWGNTIDVTLNWDFYEVFSTVYARINLNDKEVKRLFEHRIEHPWAACEEKSDTWAEQKRHVIFEVVYPILGGLVQIPVRAAL